MPPRNANTKCSERYKCTSQCTGPLRIIAAITETEPAAKILQHLKLPHDTYPPAPARAPPEDEFDVHHEGARVRRGSPRTANARAKVHSKQSHPQRSHEPLRGLQSTDAPAMPNIPNLTPNQHHARQRQAKSGDEKSPRAPTDTHQNRQKRLCSSYTYRMNNRSK